MVFQKCTCPCKLYEPAERYSRNNGVSGSVFRNLLLNEKNELHNRNLHISGLLNEEKVDMGNAKVDIENEKVDIESVLPEKDSNFTVKTTVHIHRLFCECYPSCWPQEMREV